jgi:prolyl oligopeptidase
MTKHTPWTPGNFPPTRRSDHVDVYKSAANGDVPVPDPYQWLEEYTEETNEWTTTQELFTRSYLDKNSDREKLLDLLRGSMDYAKVNCDLPHGQLSLTEIIPSSRRQLYWMMDVGTGSTIVVCRPRQVNISHESSSSNTNYRGVVVLYRSKETVLPDFSKDETLIGEVFFDVRVPVNHITTFVTPYEAQLTCDGWHCRDDLLQILPLRHIFCVLNITLRE